MKTNQRMAAIFRRTGNLTDGKTDLVEPTASHASPPGAAGLKATAANLMQDESRQLQRHLLDLTRRLLTINEAEHRRIGGRLQDQVLQSLVGIHIRLLALDKQAILSSKDLNKQIASTRRSVQKSWHAFQRAANPKHED